MEIYRMAKKNTPKALAAALGATFVASMAATPVASADANPFAMQPLSSGYQVADKGKEGNCGDKKDGKKEGNCGDKKDGKEEGKGKKDGQCGEAKCGGNKK
jgi:uncharacterized low-complexity protein